MIVTRDIVKDLLPLYVAGEASQDSREAVEELLRTDPGLAALASALEADEGAVVASDQEPRDARDGGLLALARTRRLLRRRSWLLAVALFLTGLPLSFVFGSGGLTFLLVRDAPGTAAVLWAGAAVAWAAFATTARSVRRSGL